MAAAPESDAQQPALTAAAGSVLRDDAKSSAAYHSELQARFQSLSTELARAMGTPTATAADPAAPAAAPAAAVAADSGKPMSLDQLRLEIAKVMQLMLSCYVTATGSTVMPAATANALPANATAPAPTESELMLYDLVRSSANPTKASGGVLAASPTAASNAICNAHPTARTCECKTLVPVLTHPMRVASDKPPFFTNMRHGMKLYKKERAYQTAFDPTQVRREEVNVPGARVFQLTNILVHSECDHYRSEANRFGWGDLRSEFETGYRSNDRVLVMSPEFAAVLWSRIAPHLGPADVVRVRPVCFGNGGSWRPVRLNECIKFGRYRVGSHFSPHCDGPWVPRDDESSIYTVIINLNSSSGGSSYAGGATRFYPDSYNRHDPDAKNQPAPVASVLPLAGSALIFNHDIYHDGQPVASGVKYILRTEIMFRRVDTERLPEQFRSGYLKDSQYLKMVSLYQNSDRAKERGDVKAFTSEYLKALDLQMGAQRSIGADHAEPFKQRLPYQLYLFIFGFLSHRALVRLFAVSRVWYDIGTDGQLWQNHYQKRWPALVKLEAKVADRPPPPPPAAAPAAADSADASVVAPSSPAPAPAAASIATSASSPTSSGLADSKLAEKARPRLPPPRPKMPLVKEHVLPPRVHPSIKDWYGAYKQRLYLTRNFQCAVFEIRSDEFRAALPPPAATTKVPPRLSTERQPPQSTVEGKPTLWSAQSVIGKVATFDHHRKQGFRYTFGRAAFRESKTEHVQYVMAQGVLNGNTTTDLVADLCWATTNSAYAPLGHAVLMVEPMWGWQKGVTSIVAAASVPFQRIGTTATTKAAIAKIDASKAPAPAIVVDPKQSSDHIKERLRLSLFRQHRTPGILSENAAVLVCYLYAACGNALISDHHTLTVTVGSPLLNDPIPAPVVPAPVASSVDAKSLPATGVAAAAAKNSPASTSTAGTLCVVMNVACGDMSAVALVRKYEMDSVGSWPYNAANAPMLCAKTAVKLLGEYHDNYPEEFSSDKKFQFNLVLSGSATHAIRLKLISALQTELVQSGPKPTPKFDVFPAVAPSTTEAIELLDFDVVQGGYLYAGLSHTKDRVVFRETDDDFWG